MEELKIAPLQHFTRIPAKHHGVQIEYKRMKIKCERSRSPEQNFVYCMKALQVLIGLKPWMIFGLRDDGATLFEEEGGKIFCYYERG